MTFDRYSTDANREWVQRVLLREQDKSRHLSEWRRRFLAVDTAPFEALQLTPQVDAVAQLPALSFMFQVTFTLATPYLSKDESDFHPLDNPVRKEWVFKMPMVAASSWKGALRAAFWHLGQDKDDPQVVRLFGNAREDEEGQAGRVHLYPTFFPEVTPGLEMINPHNRETGVGTVPIPLECVPEGSQGTLTLLYSPFGEPRGADAVAGDLVQLARGVVALLTTYGIGAKTSSGYGLAGRGGGKIAIHAALAQPEPAAPAPDPNLPRYLAAADRLISDLRADDGSLVSEETYQATVEAQGKTYAKKEKQIYAKAKKWWAREGRDLVEGDEAEEDEEPIPSHTVRTFSSFEQMVEVAEEIAGLLREGDAP